SSRRRHTRSYGDWSSDVCSSDLADRVMKQPDGGKALYFENVVLDNGQRSQYPVVINLFGSMRRICLALGVDDLDQIGERITEMRSEERRVGKECGSRRARHARRI